jgi:RNA polymerase sigma factor (TIGR02999 family)
MDAQVLAQSGQSALAGPLEIGASRLVGGDDDITALLIAWRGGDEDALGLLFPRVYDELRHIAHRHLRREREGHTLGTTALVNEAYLKLVDQTRAQWTDRAHFFAVAARVMRRILVDYARRHRAQKRGGAAQPVSLGDEAVGNASLVADERADMLLALDEALTQLAELDERLSRVVECRFFGGLTEEETAEALSVTARTVRRDWVKAKGWLHQALRE